MSSSCYVQQRKISYYTDVYIDLGDYLSLYLSGGHLFQSELDNPLDLKPDTNEKIFFCFNMICVSTHYLNIYDDSFQRALYFKLGLSCSTKCRSSTNSTRPSLSIQIVSLYENHSRDGLLQSTIRVLHIIDFYQASNN